MLKQICVVKYFCDADTKEIEEFINYYLSNYNVVNMIQTPFKYTQVRDKVSVTVVYETNELDNSDIELLKKIIELPKISINNVQSALSIGFNRAYMLINMLEELDIISSKEDGRKLLVTNEEALNILGGISL